MFSRFSALPLAPSTYTFLKCTFFDNKEISVHTMPAYNHFRISGQWDRRKGFEKQKVFKEDLKELTEVEWRTETGSWFQITGTWLEKEH